MMHRMVCTAKNETVLNSRDVVGSRHRDTQGRVVTADLEAEKYPEGTVAWACTV